MKLKLKRSPRLSTKPTGIASKQRRCCRSATRPSYTKSGNTVSHRARAITSFRRALRAKGRAELLIRVPLLHLPRHQPLKGPPDQEPCSENQTALNSRGAIREVAIDCCWDAPNRAFPREARVAGA